MFTGVFTRRGVTMTVLDRNYTALPLPKGKTKQGNPITDHYYWDEATNGFGLRVRLDAKRKLRRGFVFRYRHDGVQHQLPIKGTDVGRARVVAAQYRTKLDEGTNPAD